MHDIFFVHEIDSWHCVILIFPMLRSIEAWGRWMQKHKDNADQVEIKLKWALMVLQGVFTGSAILLIDWLKIPVDNIWFSICLSTLTLFTTIYVIFLTCI